MYLSGTKCSALLLGSILSLSAMAKEAVPTAGQGLHKPLCFVENNGQVTDRASKMRSDIQYKLSAPGMNLLVGNGQLHYQFNTVKHTGKAPQIAAYNMDVSLLGANPHAIAVAMDEQEYHENYYLSQYSNDGFTARAFNKVVYKEVYPGIDWVLYVKEGQLEYDFVVRPGADASLIKVAYNGATGLRINEQGGITANTPMGSVQEHKPYAYETATGKPVASAFKLHNNVVSFETAPHNGELTIDPSILWSSYRGGTAEDVITSVKQSPTGGFTYVSGYSASAVGFPVGSFRNTNLGGAYDAFAARYTNTGTLAWATYYGGVGEDKGNCIALDNTNNFLYMAGTTNSASFIANTGSFQTALGGGTDAFLVKLIAATGQRQWATYYGGIADDEANAVACDPAGNVYITGVTASTNNIASGSTVYQSNLSGTTDAFVAKFNGTSTLTVGTRLWGTYYGGSAQDEAFAITADASSVIITGQTNSVIDIATNTTTLSGTNDAFVAKLNNAGTALTWGTYLGGAGTEEGKGIVCNTTTGGIAVTGYTTSTSGIATTGAHQATYGGGAQDAFLTYFTSAGDIAWSTYYGGPNLDFGEGVCLDQFRNIIIAGATFSTSGIASTDGYQTTIGGDYDAYVAKFTQFGQRMWGTYYGNALYDYALGVSCDNTGQIAFGGHTTSTTGIATAGTNQTTFGGGVYDGFIAKFNTDFFTMINQPYVDTLICAGGSFSIPYTASTTFNAGNTFTAKLYNAAGTFVGDIGVVTATGSGTITGVVPAFAPAGTGYHIRIVSSNPVTTSADNYVGIQIVSSLPHTTITGNTPVCVGGTLHLHDEAPYAVSNYTWYHPTTGAFASGQNATYGPIALTDAGTYSVVTTHNGCPNDVATIAVTVNNIFPAAPTASASSVNCVGGSISLMANEAAGQPATYTWTGPAAFSSTMQNPVITGITAANAGVYSVRDTVNGCWSPVTTVTVTVTGTSPSSIGITVSPNDTICGGTAVMFTATPVNGGISPTYQWMNGAAPVVGAVSATWSTATLGDGQMISVVMHSDALCPSPANPVSNVIRITVITNEPVVSIFATPGASVHPGDSVRFTSLTYNVGVAPTYQWQRNEVDIPGATNSTYTIAHVTVFDSIRLVVTSTMACASTNFGISNVIVAHPNTGVATVSSLFDDVAVFPNPNTGSFTINGDMQNAGISNVDIAILNPLGQAVCTGNAALQNGRLNKTLNLEHLASGIYLLQVSGDGRSKTIRFSVQH